MMNYLAPILKAEDFNIIIYCISNRKLICFSSIEREKSLSGLRKIKRMDKIVTLVSYLCDSSTIRNQMSIDIHDNLSSNRLISNYHIIK